MYWISDAVCPYVYLTCIGKVVKKLFKFSNNRFTTDKRSKKLVLLKQPLNKSTVYQKNLIYKLYNDNDLK